MKGIQQQLQMTKKSYLSSEETSYKLNIISQDIVDNIEELLEINGIELSRTKKMYIGKCPIHEGDNSTAFNLYYTGDDYAGNWKCRTHQCEHTFKNTAIGLVRGILSHKKGWRSSSDTQLVATFKETLEYIQKFLKKDYSSIDVDFDELEKKSFIRQVKNINGSSLKKPSSLNLSRATIRKSLIYPAQYYIERGYTAEILDKYDVGLCLTPGKEMSGRVVVPIYDENYKHIVGCTGRTINPYCEICECYHIKNNHCGKEKGGLFQKWKHNKGFTAEHYLYNLWFAGKYILESGVAVLVESPGNVWRLEEAEIHNSVATFGTSLNDPQMRLLNKSGAMTLVLLMDNDEPGRKAQKAIIEQCKGLYNIICPDYSGLDIGETTVKLIHKEIKPILENIK